MIGINREVDNQLPMFANPGIPLAVVVASTSWDEPPRMRHHFTRQLLRKFNVLFVEFFPTKTPDRSKERWRLVNERLVVYSPFSSVRIPSRLYANDPLTHKIVNLDFKKQIQHAIQRLPYDRPLLFNFAWLFPEIMAEDLFAHKTYICVDEFPKMHAKGRKYNSIMTWYQAKLFQHYENEVAQGADLCLTPHYLLRNKLKKVNVNVEMLFHAHNLVLMPPCKMASKHQIIKVAFAGFIHYRLLAHWLEEVSNQRDMSLYLIGPITDSTIANLLDHPNVKHIPALPEDEMMQKLAEMDVLIMPYDPALPEVFVLTTTSKIFQYISTCKPVVISDLPNYIELPQGVIYKAKDRQDFVAQIRKAFAENSEEYIRLRKQIALENTWDHRGDLLFNLLEKYNNDSTTG